MATKTGNKKQRWLDEGLTLLAQQGADGLTIDALLGRLEVTKGSFYHHFKNRKAFTEELLGYWAHEFTSEVIRYSEEGGSVPEKLERLMSVSVTKVNLPLEIAIRAWAMIDPQVAVFQQKVDQQRQAYCCQLCEGLLEDPGLAQVWGRMLFSVYVGTQQMLPTPTKSEMAAVFEETRKLLQAASITKLKESNEGV